MGKAPFLFACVFLMLLAGCTAPTSPAGAPGAAGTPIVEGSPAGGEAASHGEVQSVDLGVSVYREGNQYVATKTIKLANDFGGASKGHLALMTFNGAISVAESTSDGWKADVLLFGRGNSDEQARAALDDLALESSDSLDGDELTISLKVKQTQQPPSGASHGGELQLSVPRSPAYLIEAGTSNGAITVTGVGGTLFDLATSNGAITLRDFAAGRVDASSSNGDITLNGRVVDVEASTSNGAIRTDLETVASGTLVFTSSNGGIDVHLAASEQHGFEVEATTSNGQVAIEVPSGEAVGSQGETYAHVRTSDYSERAIRSHVVAASSNASIDVTA